MSFNRPAFTLIEIMVVLTILIVIASLGIPMMQGTLENNRLTTGADRLRGEFLNTKIRAMDEGQIFCMRCQIDGSEIIVDRILDVHFTAGLSSRSTSNRFDNNNELDPFEKGNFTGDTQDFILHDPESLAEQAKSTGNSLHLPESVTFVEVNPVTDERSLFYTGLVNPADTTADTIDDNGETLLEHENDAPQISSGNWSAPIFFYPDGTASTATVIIKNGVGKSIQLNLRGLTGIAKVGEIANLQMP
ncbi:prepilin-type N-terminal cleavage/methylation domain-containing protein [Planctomycetales bacterium]|nr:prepilin-type N-terminal cleavage/methylation domain-containing protein [Planctomycetales bacterium]